MPLPAPVLLIAGPLTAAAATLFLSRWRRVTALAGGIFAWWLGGVLAAVHPGQTAGGGQLFGGDTLAFYGRSLLLTEDVRALFLFLFAGTGLLCLLSLFYPAGRRFVPGSLAMMSFLAAALMVRPFAFGGPLLLVAAAIGAILIQGDKMGDTYASWRYLIMMLLAVPPLLVAVWMLGRGQAALATQASWLLLISFAILLAGFPFHSWVRPVAAHAPLLVTVLLFGLVQLAVAAFVFGLLGDGSMFQQDTRLVLMLRWSGALTAVMGGLLAAAERDRGRMLGYLILLDMGVSFLTLAIPGRDGYTLAIAAHWGRFGGLLAAVIGLAQLRRYEAQAQAEPPGRARRPIPWLALFAYGCFSLVGLPLTPGFIGRWGLLTAVIHAPPPAPWLASSLLLAMGGGVTAVLYSLGHWLPDPSLNADQGKNTGQETF